MSDEWNGIERRGVSWREITDHMAETNIILKTLSDNVGKQNGRLTKLENWRWFIMGSCVVICFLVNVIFRK